MSLHNISGPEWNHTRKGMLNPIKLRFVFVRHAESEANQLLMTGEKTRHTNPPLTTIGEEQADEVGKFLKDFKFDEFWYSPLLRTHHTTAYIKKHLKTRPPIFHASHLLLERWHKDDEFVFTHKPDKTLNMIPQPSGLIHLSRDTPFETNVDTFLQAHINTSSRATRKQILVVGHSLWINEALKNLTHSSKTNYHLSNASVTIIDITKGNNAEVHVVNHTSHLKNTTGNHVPLKI